MELKADIIFIIIGNPHRNGFYQQFHETIDFIPFVDDQFLCREMKIMLSNSTSQPLPAPSIASFHAFGMSRCPKSSSAAFFLGPAAIAIQ